ncbi:MAG: hypothetical protein O3B25_15250 [Verrucomicrobia bacterium]|nr:hypothetical protein [Verrucomicrobiota bacterium]
MTLTGIACRRRFRFHADEYGYVYSDSFADITIVTLNLYPEPKNNRQDKQSGHRPVAVQPIAMQPLRKNVGEDRRAFAKRAARDFVRGLEELRAKQGNLKMPRPPGA